MLERPFNYRTVYVSFSEVTAVKHEIHAAVTGKRLLVLGYELVSGGNNTVKFVAGAVDLTGAMNLSAVQSVRTPVTASGTCHGAAGAALYVTMSAGVAVGGWVAVGVEV